MREEIPSSTARLIARGILVAERDPELRRLVAPGEGEILGRILDEAPGSRISRLALRAFPRKLLRCCESLFLPGIVAHWLVRKRKIERVVRGAITAGAEEVVVIAAGFDSLCLRLRAEFPGVRFTEIDHPATQAPKRAAFPETANFQYLACDLAKGPLPGLPEREHRVVVVEGLTMYLGEEEIAELFRRLSEKCRTLVFTFMEKGADGAVGFKNQNPLVAPWLKWRGEPFHWGVTRDELPDFLRAHGFRLEDVFDECDLRREILGPLELQDLTLARGDCLCVATPISP